MTTTEINARRTDGQRVDLSRPDNSDYEKGRSVLVMALWHFIGSPLVRSNLMPVSSVKCAILRLFGAKIGSGVYAKPGLRVKFPWYLSVGDHCWLGEDAWIDNLAPGDHWLSCLHFAGGLPLHR